MRLVVCQLSFIKTDKKVFVLAETTTQYLSPVSALSSVAGYG